MSMWSQRTTVISRSMAAFRKGRFLQRSWFLRKPGRILMAQSTQLPGEDIFRVAYMALT